MTTLEPNRRRSELGAFLKASRGRVRPQDVGLPPGERRRTAGLRREEVALLAGVGVTWYTWLEQGRPINASGQVLDAVARTLQLDTAQRRHLYRLAEATPLRMFWDSCEAVPDTLPAVLDALNPAPAVLLNGLFDVLASNTAHQNLFRDWHSLPCVHRNLLWCNVTEPTARDMFLNYDEEIPFMVARLRADYATHVGDPEWEEDIRRLADTNEEFAALWEQQQVAGPMIRHRRCRIPGLKGVLAFAVSELTVAACPSVRIQVNTPEDDHTRAVMAEVMAMPPLDESVA